MKLARFTLAVAMAGIVLACQPTRSAAGATTLQMLRSGQSIQVGQVLFNHWRISSNYIERDFFDPGPTTFDLNNIQVTGDASDPLNPKLVFTGLQDALIVTAGGNGSVTRSRLIFDFDVNVMDPTLRWSGASLTTQFTGNALTWPSDPTYAPRANAMQFQSDTTSVQDLADSLGIDLDEWWALFKVPIALSPVNVRSFGGGGASIVDQSGVPSVVSVPAVVTSSSSQVLVMETRPTQSIGLTSFEQGYRLTPVPEPASIALLGGLAGLAGVRRRRAEHRP